MEHSIYFITAIFGYLSGSKEWALHLIVGVSTDEFNRRKGKQSLIPFYQRIEIVRSLRFVDEVFAENTWDAEGG